MNADMLTTAFSAVRTELADMVRAGTLDPRTTPNLNDIVLEIGAKHLRRPVAEISSWLPARKTAVMVFIMTIYSDATDKYFATSGEVEVETLRETKAAFESVLELEEVPEMKWVFDVARAAVLAIDEILMLCSEGV